MSKYSESMLKVIDNVSHTGSFKFSSPSKISTKENRAFSLPAGPEFACPGATKACDGCYATKKRHLWFPVQQAFANNWNLLRDLEKKKKFNKAVSLLLESIPNSTEIFRIHESGDFYSQWYVDVWTEVIRQRRDVMFWTYTRSFNLDFSKIVRQPNFTLWASTDNFNLKKSNSFIRRYKNSNVKRAYGPWEHDALVPNNSFACPVTTGKMDVAGACEKCMLCVTKHKTSKNVVFMAH